MENIEFRVKSENETGACGFGFDYANLEVRFFTNQIYIGIDQGEGGTMLNKDQIDNLIDGLYKLREMMK